MWLVTKQTARHFVFFAICVLATLVAEAVGPEETVAARLLQDVRSEVRDLPQISNREDVPFEWAGRQEVLSIFAQVEASFGCYDAARSVIARIDDNESRTHAREAILAIAAVRGDTKAAVRLLDEIPVETSLGISEFLQEICGGAPQETVIALLKHFGSKLSRSHTCMVYCRLATAADSRAESVKFASEAESRYTLDPEDYGVQEAIYQAMLASGRMADADKFVGEGFTNQRREDVARDTAIRLAKSCRRDEAVIIAGRITYSVDYDNCMLDVLRELHARDAIHADDIDAMALKIHAGSEAADALLYYGCLAALSEDQLPRLIEFAERIDDPWWYLRSVNSCLRQSGDRGKLLIESLGGAESILAKARRVGENWHIGTAASLAVALARSDSRKAAHGYFDVAAAGFELGSTLSLEESANQGAYCPEIMLALAEASIVLDEQPRMHKLLRGREKWFAEHRDESDWPPESRSDVLTEVAQAWCKLGELGEFERMCLAEEAGSWREIPTIAAIEYGADEDNARAFVAMIDRIASETSYRIWYKLVLIKSLSKSDWAYFRALIVH